MWLAILLFFIGMIVGCVLTRFIFCKRSIGTLRIDTSDPNDGPYLFMELTKSMESFMYRKWVVLKLSLESYLPRE